MPDHLPPPYYSQLGQDQWIAEYVFPGERSGYFIEIGAGDGLLYSNSKYLEDLGWTGVCVEPSRQFSNLVRQRTARTTCIDRVIYSREDTVDFLESESSAAFGGDPFNHLSGVRSHLHAYNPNGATIARRTTTLATLLDLVAAPRFIHYLSLDTEGSELEILKGADFTRHAFGAITVEHNRDEAYAESLRVFLEARGYRRHVRIAYDDWYLGDGVPSPPPYAPPAHLVQQ